MASPYCLLHPDGKAIVVFPEKTTDFTLASARECRYCDCGSGWFGKDAEHLQFLFKRVCMGFTAGTSPREFDLVHGVGRVEHSLSSCITEHAAEKVFDVAKRSAAQIFLTGNG
ncbi:MAG: hypothetical protein WBW83_22410 [Terriglobales bacterium]